MLKTRRGFFHVAAFMLALLFACPLQAAAAEFVADLYEERTGTLSSGRVFVKGSLMRREVQQAGLVTITIFNIEKGTAWIINALGRTYAEVPSQLGEHPLLLARKWEALGEVETIGTGEIDGRECDILRYEQSRTPDGPLVQWVDRELGFPVRTEIPEKLYLLEYRNIDERPVPPAAFSIPPDYREVDAPGR